MIFFWKTWICLSGVENFQILRQNMQISMFLDAIFEFYKVLTTIFIRKMLQGQKCGSLWKTDDFGYFCLKLLHFTKTDKSWVLYQSVMNWPNCVILYQILVQQQRSRHLLPAACPRCSSHALRATTGELTSLRGGSGEEPIPDRVALGDGGSIWHGVVGQLIHYVEMVATNSATRALRLAMALP